MFVNKNNKYNDVLRFIELYRSHEVLWNRNLSSYRRNDLKIKAYSSIADEAKMSVEEVKKKIKSLRTSYSAEKSKVESSKQFGCDTDSLYIPSVFWYNEMTFLDEYLIRRKTVDNSNQVDNSSKGNVCILTETSIDSEPGDVSFSQIPFAAGQNAATTSSSKKRRHSLEPKSKLDDALEKIISINKEASVFETFGESVGKQIKEFPEEDAYKVMAEIQCVISKRKVAILRKKSMCPPSRTSTPLSDPFD